MKNSILSLILIVVFFSCTKKDMVLPDNLQNNTSSFDQPVARLNNQEKIKLFKAWSSVGYVYAGYYSKRKNIYAEVANLGYNKKVYVHHKMADDTWMDFELKYIKAADNNTEIWGWENDYSGYTSSPNNNFGNQFVLKYEVNGQTYWDNNAGLNYSMGLSDGMYLQTGLNVSVDTYASYFSNYGNATSSSFNVVADIRNIAYNKIVTVVYTSNNWQTVQTAPLNFAQYYSIGNGVSLISPNVFGTERWIANINLNSMIKNIEYAVSYKVNGIEYWDNNFGNNYKVTLKNY